MRHTIRTRARIGAIAAVPLVAVLLLGGCAASPSSMPPQYGEPQYAPAGEAADSSSLDGGIGISADPSVVSAAGRSVITTGWATVLVDDTAVAIDEAIRITEAAGGRIDGRNESSASDYWGGGSSLVIRVPSERLTAVLDEIEALGTVQQVSLSSSDVTLQVTDLDARIASTRAAIERLDALLAQATDVDDLVAIETAISDRQAQLESMLAEQRWLADQVSLSTIEVQFVTEPVVEEPAPQTFLDGIARGWEAFVAFAGGVLVVLGFLLPWLIPLAIVGVVVLVVVRIVAGRTRRAAASAPVPAQSPVAATPAETAPPAAPSPEG